MSFLFSFSLLPPPYQKIQLTSKMKKQPPEPNNPIFNDLSDIKDQQIKELEIYDELIALRHSRGKRKMDDLLKRQKQAIEQKKQGFDDERDSVIKVLSLQKLDETVSKIHPTLRPTYLRGDDYNNLLSAARSDAKAEIESAEHTEIHDMGEKFLADQERLLTGVKTSVCRQKFNQKGRETTPPGSTQQINPDKGIER